MELQEAIENAIMSTDVGNLRVLIGGGFGFTSVRKIMKVAKSLFKAKMEQFSADCVLEDVSYRLGGKYGNDFSNDMVKVVDHYEQLKVWCAAKGGTPQGSAKHSLTFDWLGCEIEFSYFEWVYYTDNAKFEPFTQMNKRTYYQHNNFYSETMEYWTYIQHWKETSKQIIKNVAAALKPFEYYKFLKL